MTTDAQRRPEAGLRDRSEAIAPTRTTDPCAAPPPPQQPLVHRDGHEVLILPRRDGNDARELEHVWPRPGRMAGPHWHPILEETFTVGRGQMPFRVGAASRSIRLRTAAEPAPAGACQTTWTVFGAALGEALPQQTGGGA